MHCSKQLLEKFKVSLFVKCDRDIKIGKSNLQHAEEKTEGKFKSQNHRL